VRSEKDKENGKMLFYFLNRLGKNEAEWITFGQTINTIIKSFNNTSLISNLGCFFSLEEALFVKSIYKNDFLPQIKKVDNNILDLSKLHILGVTNITGITEIYRCIDTNSQKIVALKILKQEHGDSQILRARIINEIQIIRKLQKSDSVVKFISFSTSGSRPYYTYEYELGGTLYEYIIRWGDNPMDAKLILIKSCIDNLCKIHAYNIIHRDIKPSNIFIRDGKCIYADFSISKSVKSDFMLTQHGEDVGTYKYNTSIEEIKEHGFSIYSDYYSLGIIIMEIILGRIIKSREEGISALKKTDFEGVVSDIFLYSVINLSSNIKDNRIAALNEIKKELNQINISGKKIKKLNREEKVVINSVGIELVKISKGKFIMGGTKFKNEMPVHHVVISKDFLIGKYPITNRQFSRFRKATNYNNKDRMFLYHLRNSRKFDKSFTAPNSPVVFISWEDAREYVLWLSEKENKDYGLPTEAEWEYVCRCGTRNVYSGSNNHESINTITNNITEGVVPVSKDRNNAWEVCDMLGNCWEWCYDHYDIDSSKSRFSPFYLHCSQDVDLVIDPCNTPSKILVIDDQDLIDKRVGKGGAFASKPHNCRPANRRGEFLDVCIRSFGFRIVCRNL